MRWAWEAAVVWAALVAALLPTRPVLAQDVVWLWASALASTSPDGQTVHRQLEINWEVTQVLEGDWVGLFDHDPVQDMAAAPVESAIPGATSGYYLTSATLPITPLHTSMAEGQCLGWWAAYVRQNVPILVDCIKVRPRWMSAMSAQLGSVPFKDVVLPGVHDAGTYTSYSQHPQVSDNALMKYAITQDESIYNTLVLGHRYIDLRAGYFVGDPNTPYWVVHGLTVWRPLHEVLAQLGAFVRETGEAVVVEVGGFTFFESDEQHLGCVALFEEELSDVLAPVSLTWDVPLTDLLQSQASLIILYKHHVVDNNPLFWPGIPSRWANAQSIDELETFYIRVFEEEGAPPSPWIMFGQLTGEADSVLTDSLNGLRDLADEANRNMTRWLRTRWADQLSIISCDFVLSAGYVDVAIELNQKRFP